MFAINLQTDQETTLYSFTGGADGYWPAATLLYRGGLLYGETTEGGNCADKDFCGTIFTVNPSTGAENTVYTFAAPHLGQSPLSTSNLIEHDGLIYGTTLYGGDLSCGRGGCGVVFSLNPANNEYKVVQTITSNHDQVAALSARGDRLYESVFLPHGRHNNSQNQGQLASFDLNTGKRRVLYRFDQGRNGADGANPQAPLIFAHGVFYGTTSAGGSQTACQPYGCGTIFQYVP